MIDSFKDEYEFLSNFSPAAVELDGITYQTVEHAFQAAKTLDDTERETVRQATTAGRAKRLGRKVTLRDNWEAVKIDVMEDLVRQKFTSPQLREWLLETGKEELVEGNKWNDTFWGVCRGRGENNLGKILMRVREELK